MTQEPAHLSPASLARMHALFGDGYPSEVRTLASHMDTAGQSIEAIRAALLECYGKAPDPETLARLLPEWREEVLSRAHRP